MGRQRDVRVWPIDDLSMKYLRSHHILDAFQLLTVVLYLHLRTVLRLAKTRVFPTSLFLSVMQDLIWLAHRQGNARLIERGVVQCLFVKVGIYCSRRTCCSRGMFFAFCTFKLNCLLVFLADGKMPSLLVRCCLLHFLYFCVKSDYTFSDENVYYSNFCY